MEIYQEELRRFRVDSNRAADARMARVVQSISRSWNNIYRRFTIPNSATSILALTTITYLPVMYA